MRIRISAEAKMGELLGPAEEQGKRSDLEPVSAANKLDGAERVAQHKARKVYAAVQTEAGADYLATADEPTRAGLLRAARPEPVERDGSTDITRVRAGRRFRASRSTTMRASGCTSSFLRTTRRYADTDKCS